jgi:hypothetical protein
MTSRTTGHLKLLEDAVSRLPASVPTRETWEHLQHALVDLKGRIDDLNDTVKGDGNGEKGLLNRVIHLEDEIRGIKDDVKVSRSDTREVLNMMRKQPAQPKATEKWWFLVLMMLGAGVISPILLWLATDIFPRIFSIPHP